MRLLNVHTLEFCEYPSEVPRYVILSHRWLNDETTFKEVKRKNDNDQKKQGYKKIVGFTDYVKQNLPGIDWVWADTCCINRKSDAEVSTAINSMYQYFHNAEVCLAYLADVESPDEYEEFERSVWFLRGWTLQELLAPPLVIFLTRNWKIIGHKGRTRRSNSNTVLNVGRSLTSSIVASTGIPEMALHHSDQIEMFSVQDRFAWMKGRETTRAEDMWYSMLGIFNVHMPAIYGEGRRSARRRLLEEIQKTSAQRQLDRHLSESFPTETFHEVCWLRKGGCSCQCHGLTQQWSRDTTYLFVNFSDPQAITTGCNRRSCNATQYLNVRWSGFSLGFPRAFTVALWFRSNSWIPRLNLSASRVCRFTAPAFVTLLEILHGPLIEDDETSATDCQERFQIALRQKVADFKTTFRSGRASFEDVNPAGDGYLDIVLGHRSDFDFKVQQELVTFLLAEAPQHVKENPILLHLCAVWEDSANRSEMLRVLLRAGVDPGDLGESKGFFRRWRPFQGSRVVCWSHQVDRFYVNWMRSCLELEPGFAECDVLSETLLTGSDHDFNQVLQKVRSGRSRVSSNALGQSALHLSILNPSRLQSLLDAGLDKNCTDSRGGTPLMYAAVYGMSSSIRLLVNRGADLFLKDERGWTFLDHAIFVRHQNVVEDLGALLRNINRGKDAKLLSNQSLKKLSLVQVETEEFEALFNLGGNPHITFDDRTLMHTVHTEDQAQALIRWGYAGINSQTKRGKTPLMQAALINSKDTVLWLLKNGGLSKICDKSGRTALHYLLYNDNSASVRADKIRLHVNLTGSLNLLLGSGDSLICPDRCICACSLGGCTALTFALHNALAQRNWWRSSVAINVLMSIIDSGSQSELKAFYEALMRYRKFEERKLEHTCCQGSWNEQECDEPFSRSWVRRNKEKDASHMDFRASLDLHNSSEISSQEAIHELARFYHMRYCRLSGNECPRGSRRWDYHPFRIDYQNDTFLPMVSKSHHLLPSSVLNIAEYKTWLQWCLRNKFHLHTQSSLEEFVLKGLSIVEELEVEVQKLEVIVGEDAADLAYGFKSGSFRHVSRNIQQSFRQSDYCPPSLTNMARLSRQEWRRLHGNSK